MKIWHKNQLKKPRKRGDLPTNSPIRQEACGAGEAIKKRKDTEYNVKSPAGL